MVTSLIRKLTTKKPLYIIKLKGMRKWIIFLFFLFFRAPEIAKLLKVSQ